MTLSRACDRAHAEVILSCGTGREGRATAETEARVCAVLSLANPADLESDRPGASIPPCHPVFLGRGYSTECGPDRRPGGLLLQMDVDFCSRRVQEQRRRRWAVNLPTTQMHTGRHLLQAGINSLSAD